jgi:WD40 repeat protein
MACFRQGCALALSAVLWATAAGAAEKDQALIARVLYNRPVLVVDLGMHTSEISSASVDADGRWGVTGSTDKTVRVWSLANGTLKRTIRLPAGPGPIGNANTVAISPDGSLISVGGVTPEIKQFVRKTGVMVGLITKGLHNSVSRLAYSPDGTRLGNL